MPFECEQLSQKKRSEISRTE